MIPIRKALVWVWCHVCVFHRVKRQFGGIEAWSSLEVAPTDLTASKEDPFLFLRSGISSYILPLKFPMFS